MHSFPVQHIPETASTNSEILEHASKTGSRKMVLVADHQTNGRGQFGRKWFSPPGENLLCSIYFTPQIHPREASQFTQIACRAVLETLTDYGISCMIKPPNDILAEGKKICGILTESSTSGEKLNYVVVGIGLNINSPEEKLIPEATSMRVETSQSFDRRKILNTILQKFENGVSSHFSIELDQLVGS